MKKIKVFENCHPPSLCQSVATETSNYPPTSHTFIRISQHICPQIQGSLYKGLATRTKRVAAKSIAAIPAESIPFIGVAVLIADTGHELYAACQTVRDLDRLYANLGMADEAPDEVMHSVCDPELPVLSAL